MGVCWHLGEIRKILNTDICTISIIMKTTLNLHDALVFEAKRFAAEQSTTLTRLIEDGLRLRLAQVKQAINKPKKIKMMVLPGSGGLAQGLDGTSNRALLEAAEA